MGKITRDDPKFDGLIDLILTEFADDMAVDNPEAFKASIESVELAGNELRLHFSETPKIEPDQDDEEWVIFCEMGRNRK